MANPIPVLVVYCPGHDQYRKFKENRSTQDEIAAEFAEKGMKAHFLALDPSGEGRTSQRALQLARLDEIASGRFHDLYFKGSFWPDDKSLEELIKAGTDIVEFTNDADELSALDWKLRSLLPADEVGPSLGRYSTELWP